MRGECCAVGVGGKVVRLSQTTLLVAASVDEVGVVERELDGTVHNVVGSLNTEHERVVLIADLVPPAAEAATGVNVQVLKLRQEVLEDALSLERGSGVAVVEAAVVCGNDLVLRLDHIGVDETLDALLEDLLLVDRFHGRLGNLQHDGPVGASLGLGRLSLAAVGQVEGGQLLAVLGLVVRRVVGEDGGAVEGAVVLREVQPALVANALRAGATETDTNDVGSRVEETLGQADKLLVAHPLNELVYVHGRDELVVLDSGAILESDNLALSVNLLDGALLAQADLVLRQSVCNSDPDTTGTVASGEAEGGVRTPVTGDLVEDDILGDELQVGGSDTLSEPLALHLGHSLVI